MKTSAHSRQISLTKLVASFVTAGLLAAAAFPATVQAAPNTRQSTTTTKHCGPCQQMRWGHILGSTGQRWCFKRTTDAKGRIISDSGMYTEGCVVQQVPARFD